jgi:beta-glucosidase
VVARFEKYVSHVYTCLGDLVSDWVTINEPNVYLALGYLYGIWPPGQKNPVGYFKGARNMIAAHVAAYHRIHALARRRVRPETRVGAAYHLRAFTTGNNRRGEHWVIRFLERYFHEIFTDGMSVGRLRWPLGKSDTFGRGKYQDFWGVNYYTRDMVCLQPKMFRQGGVLQVKRGVPCNDLGWELYPRGLYDLCRRCYRRLRQPVFILENGTCDRLDAFRARFIYDHLLQVKRLIDDGVDVQRYYHWTLMDNFEWAEGLRARFGLIAVDYATQRRTVRASGRFYGDICRTGGVSEAMIARYSV